MEYTDTHKEVAKKINTLWKSKYKVMKKSDYTITYTDRVIDEITNDLFEDLVLITDEYYDGEFFLKDYDFSLHDLKGKTYKEIIFYLAECYGTYMSEAQAQDSQMAEQNSHTI